MSCRFAGCPSLTAFWDAIMSRRSMLTVPGAAAEIPPGQKNLFDRPYPVRLGQLGDLYACVSSMQHFPRQVNAGENQDLYFATQLAFDALTDASIRVHSRDPIRGSVRLGYAPPFNASTLNWLQHTAYLDQTMEILRRFLPNAPEEYMDEMRTKLKESLPEPNAASFLLGSGYRFVSWIARECSFWGTAEIADAGLLTGAATVMDAMADLRSGKSDVALAGTVTAPLNRSYLEGLSAEVEFSMRPGLAPFSEDASGTIPGEGGAFFVLKRREDALKARDRIYALIRSVEIGHTPDHMPQRILSAALDAADAPVPSVGLVEADGCGIRDMELREIDAIQRLWGDHRPGGALVGVGSVKGNIGHTLRTGMAAGLVKAALALRKRVLPPQVAPEHPSERMANLASSAYLLTEARPWIVGDRSQARRAVVLGSNFIPCNPIGVASRSGRAAAILLEEEPEDSR